MLRTVKKHSNFLLACNMLTCKHYHFNIFLIYFPLVQSVGPTVRVASSSTSSSTSAPHNCVAKNWKLLVITGSDTFSFFLSAEDPDPVAKPGNSCWGRWLSSGSISAKPVWAGGDGRSWGTLTPRSMTGSFPWCSAPELSHQVTSELYEWNQLQAGSKHPDQSMSSHLLECHNTQSRCHKSFGSLCCLAWSEQRLIHELYLISARKSWFGLLPHSLWICLARPRQFDWGVVCMSPKPSADPSQLGILFSCLSGLTFLSPKSSRLGSITVPNVYCIKAVPVYSGSGW